jgi:hypothetical protein
LIYKLELVYLVNFGTENASINGPSYYGSIIVNLPINTKISLRGYQNFNASGTTTDTGTLLSATFISE